MLIHTDDDLYQSSLLSIKPLVHGYSSRQWGDMKFAEKNRHKLMERVFPAGLSLVMPEQVHGGDVTVVSDGQKAIIPGVDALVYKKNGASVALGVVVADCVPLLLADPKERIIAVVHLGWKGILLSLVAKTIDTMQQLGASPARIIAAIGPHIGMCHYDVPKDRVDKFEHVFGNDPKVISFSEGAWRLDIGYAVLSQLLTSGVRYEHIDAPVTCTACQIDRFFSYRKDTKESFGEIMGVIAYA